MNIGDKVELSVSAEGSGTLTYQWKKDGNLISDDSLPNLNGASTHALTISSFMREHAGSYKCLVSSDSGQKLESKDAELICKYPKLCVL